MKKSFAEWVWQNLTMSMISRFEKEINVGIFLLISQTVWLAVPFSPLRVILHFGQMLLGTVLAIHGLYSKSVEFTERERKWREDIEKDIEKREADTEERYRESLNQLREMTIKRIVEADGISLEEATKKADETEWLDPKGNVVSPPWMRETEREAEE